MDRNETFDHKQQKTILESFSNALRREGHVLTQRPDLLWQQLYNYLQWEDEGIQKILSSELNKRSKIGNKLWINNLTPLEESKSLLINIERGKFIRAIAISPNNCHLSIAHLDEVNILDLYKNRDILTIKGISRGINTLVYSPDGSILASANDDRTVKLWDSLSGEILCVLRGHDSEIISCNFSPDGKRIVSGGKDEQIHVWDIATGNLLNVINKQGLTPIYDCKFSTNGKYIYWTQGNFRLRKFDFTSSQKIEFLFSLPKIIEINENWKTNAFAESPDGSRVVLSCLDNVLRVWDITKNKLLHSLIGHNAKINSCNYSHTGDKIVSASDDHKVIVWDDNSGDMYCSLEGHTSPVTACEFSADDRLIISADSSGAIKFWEPKKHKQITSHEKHSGIVWACEYSPDGKYIASSSLDGSVRIWNSSTGRSMRVLKRIQKDKNPHLPPITSLGISSDGFMLASSDDGKTINVWDISTGDQIHSLTLDKLVDIRGCKFSPDNQYIGIISWSKIYLWNINTWNTVRYIEHISRSKTANDFCFSPDMKHILTACVDNTLLLWDFKNQELIHILKAHTDQVEACDYSPDKTSFVSASKDGSLRLWNTQTYQQTRIFQDKNYIINDCKFSPDGCYIFTVSNDKTLKVLDKINLDIIASLPFRGYLTSIAVHPWLPNLSCGEESGSIYRVMLKGIKYNAIIVTASNKNNKLIIRCPACQKEHPIKEEQLGCEMNCPTPGCGLWLKINPFTIGQAPEHTPSPPLARPKPRPRIEPQPIPKRPSISHQIRQMAISNTGQLLSGFTDGKIKLKAWKTDTFTQSSQIHNAAISALAVHPPGVFACAGFSDGTLMKFSLRFFKPYFQQKYTSEVSALCVALYGEIAAGFDDGSLICWNMLGDLVQFTGHEKRITAVAILPSGQVVSAAEDRKVRLWEPKSGKMIQSFSGIESPITVLCADEKTNRITCGCEDTLAFLWDLETFKTKNIYTLKTNILAASGDRQSVLVGDDEGKVQVFSLETGKNLYFQEYQVPIRSGVLSPDGKQGAVLDEKGHVYRFDVP